MIKKYILSQKKVNSGRIVTAELPFPLFAKAIIENKQLKSFEKKKVSHEGEKPHSFS